METTPEKLVTLGFLITTMAQIATILQTICSTMFGINLKKYSQEMVFQSKGNMHFGFQLTSITLTLQKEFRV
ncbi:hypothetical protein Golax_015664 [Gossypium laxum]|uniref:Uncharacterized protein n=1 Tax=Gossypium laxum TaxID=34288 RepID=A0A7J8YUX7_9ROSI|nr:hypothetical protein [Gossypium laxum]